MSIVANSDSDAGIDGVSVKLGCVARTMKMSYSLSCLRMSLTPHSCLPPLMLHLHLHQWNKQHRPLL